MNNNNIEPMLTYALNEAGQMVSVKNVAKGLDCKCKCPKCGQPLIARKGEVRQAHFAHYGEGDNNGSPTCHGYYMTALHKLAEQIIEVNKSVMVPPYNEIEARKLSFVEVEVEKRNDRNDLQPDVVGITEDGQRWHIEICNTNEVNEDKRKKIKESNIICVEINVKDVALDDLENFLLNSIENREWINNPVYDEKLKANYQHILEKYRETHHFDIKKITECQQNCPLYNWNASCVYCIKKLRYYGEDYVLCEKAYVKPELNSHEGLTANLQNKYPQITGTSRYPKHETNSQKNQAGVVDIPPVEKAIEPVEKFLKENKINGFLIDYNGIKTKIINIDRTRDGRGVIVEHADENYRVYVTLVTFPNGMPKFKHHGQFFSIDKADNVYAKLREERVR